MKKRNVIVCRVKCAGEEGKGGEFHPTPPNPLFFHPTSSWWWLVSGTRKETSNPWLGDPPRYQPSWWTVFTVTDDSWRRVDMCNGADEGWARVIEARGGGGRPRKSRGRAIAEAPPHNGYLGNANGDSCRMYRRRRCLRILFVCF